MKPSLFYSHKIPLTMDWLKYYSTQLKVFNLKIFDECYFS